MQISGKISSKGMASLTWKRYDGARLITRRSSAIIRRLRRRYRTIRKQTTWRHLVDISLLVASAQRAGSNVWCGEFKRQGDDDAGFVSQAAVPGVSEAHVDIEGYGGWMVLSRPWEDSHQEKQQSCGGGQRNVGN